MKITVPEMAGLRELCSLFSAGDVKLVGGVVRDLLMGMEPHDIDLATTVEPDKVMELCAAAGLTVIPTGLAHGTVTVIVKGGPVEITTLRRDIETDGRHASVAYTTDWSVDAFRRDFTVNALYADPFDGTVLDCVGGLDDLQAGCVRFAGDPGLRIAEDALRIMRFFRFVAKLDSVPDPASLKACTAAADDVANLSRERIAQEFIKLLSLPFPAPAMQAMAEAGVLRVALPLVDEGSVARLAKIINNEARLEVDADPLLRLASMLVKPDDATAVAIFLKLSNADRKRLESAFAVKTGGILSAETYAYGTQAVLDAILLDRAGLQLGKELYRAIERWEVPTFPLKGKVLIEAGMQPGPLVSQTMKAIERDWVNASFPGAAWMDERLAKVAVQ